MSLSADLAEGRNATNYTNTVQRFLHTPLKKITD